MGGLLFHSVVVAAAQARSVEEPFVIKTPFMPESTWELMLPFQVFHPMLGDGQMSNSTTFQATKLKGKKVRGENGDRLMHNLSRKGRF